MARAAMTMAELELAAPVVARSGPTARRSGGAYARMPTGIAIGDPVASGCYS